MTVGEYYADEEQDHQGDIERDRQRQQFDRVPASDLRSVKIPLAVPAPAGLRPGRSAALRAQPPLAIGDLWRCVYRDDIDIARLPRKDEPGIRAW